MGVARGSRAPAFGHDNKGISLPRAGGHRGARGGHMPMPTWRLAPRRGSHGVVRGSRAPAVGHDNEWSSLPRARGVIGGSRRVAAHRNIRISFLGG